MCSQPNSNQRFASFPGSLTRESAISSYFKTYGRMPKVVLSPAENGTDKWYLGYLSEQEAAEFGISLLQDALIQSQQS